MGEFKWLTVVSPDGHEDVELALEPMGFPPVKQYQKALFEAVIPLTAFATEDIQNEYKRLKKLGVSFHRESQQMELITTILFEDSCGNLIQLYQVESDKS